MNIKEVRHILTYKCNLKCLHCYLSADENKEDGPKEISQKDLYSFYNFFKPEVVSATGGEPLLRIDRVLNLAEAIASYGGSLELVTNGMLLTSEIVKALRDINYKTFYQISFDGPEEYHNHLRNNEEAYKKALQAIVLASASGALTKVRLTACTENLDLIPEVIKILDGFERKNITLVVRPVVPVGRACDNKLTANYDFKYLDMFKNMPKVISIEVTDNNGKCGCGVDTIAIDPSGDIYPCTYFTSKKDYKMGNIVTDFEYMKEHQEFKNYSGGCYARHIKAFSI